LQHLPALVLLPSGDATERQAGWRLRLILPWVSACTILAKVWQSARHLQQVLLDLVHFWSLVLQYTI